MQPTAGRRTASLSDDFHTSTADYARPRQRWLILFSLGTNRVRAAMRSLFLAVLVVQHCRLEPGIKMGVIA
jgi:hypothetical protein